MINALKKLFVISRPVSWPNTAYPFAAGYLLSGSSIDLTFIIGTLYFLGPYNLLMYGVNDVFDYESDIRNPRKGGIEGAVTAKAFHSTILWSSLITNVPFIITLILLGSLLSAIILSIVVFFVIAYSLKGLRFKEKPFLDSITSSIHFVGPLVFALSLTGFNVTSVPYVIAFFLWGIASHAYGAVQDIIPDRQGKLSSIATVLGARRTIILAVLFYLTSVVLVAWQGGLSIIVAITTMAYIINIIGYLNVNDKTSGSTRPGWRRFIWLNYITGFVVTLVLIVSVL